MTPHMQEFLNDPSIGQYGDCQRAAIASLLDLSMKDVPHFLQDVDGDAAKFQVAVRDFMKRHGFKLERGTGHDDIAHDEFHLIYGPSPRGNGMWHAVVGQGGRIVHDPHPSGAGLLKPYDWVYVKLVDWV